MSKDDNISIDEEVIVKLTGAADTMASLLEKVMENHDSQSNDMDYFKRDLGLVRDSIKYIAKVLHEGNGEKPLIARVAILETQVENLISDVNEMEARELERQRLADEQDMLDKKGKWGVRVAIVSAAAALGVEVIRLLT